MIYVTHSSEEICKLFLMQETLEKRWATTMENLLYPFMHITHVLQQRKKYL